LGVVSVDRLIGSLQYVASRRDRFDHGSAVRTRGQTLWTADQGKRREAAKVRSPIKYP
jgi:hypothetical protein